MPEDRSSRVTSRLPLGLAAGLVAVAVVVVLVSAALSRPSAATSTTTAPPPSTGMVVRNVQAIPLAGSGNPVIVIATIENRTRADDRLLGASSPIAATGGLYATCGCTPGSTDASGMGNKSLMPSWLIRAGETTQLRTGAGEIILNGLAEPLAPGAQLQVTFEFEDAAPVTVTVTVVSSAN